MLRASTTKAPKLSLKTFLLVRSRECLRPFADMTLVRADVSVVLRPSSLCSASSCSPAQHPSVMSADHVTCKQHQAQTRLPTAYTAAVCHVPMHTSSEPVALILANLRSCLVVTMACGMQPSQVCAALQHSVRCARTAADRLKFMHTSPCGAPT